MTELSVTEEMIEVGTGVIFAWGRLTPSEAKTIYLAMKAKEPAGDVEGVTAAIRRELGLKGQQITDLRLDEGIERAARAAIAAATPGDGMLREAWPAELTPELADILGRPCFMFIKLSQAYRAAGFQIDTQAEAEQAFFLHRWIGFWLSHGTGWKETAEADIEDAIAKAKE